MCGNPSRLAENPQAGDNEPLGMKTMETETESGMQTMHTEKKSPRRGNGGRPSKWPPDVALRLGAALQSGCWPFDAARRAGIGKSTLHRWLRAGLNGDPRFTELVEMFKKSWNRYTTQWPW
jgi:hypothetical protein